MSHVPRFVDLVGVKFPIVLAPMAGPGTAELAAAVTEAGGLGSLPCAMLTREQIAGGVAAIRGRTSLPFNLNFFCHQPPDIDVARETAWSARLAPYYRELGLDPSAPASAADRKPFDETMCELVEELRPPVVSFHFGLPGRALLGRVKAAGATVLSSATTTEEARWLEQHGCDVIIAQGYEAGGHRGLFLADDIRTQPGTLALVPQVVDAVKVPVIAAGGIADARGIAAALALGASAVQLGTAYLRCPEARLHPAHRAALKAASDDGTALTNVFTGRPARGLLNRLVREVGPMSTEAPAFPRAARAIGPLRASAEADGRLDFTPLWAGQAARLGRDLPAAELTRSLMEETRALLAYASGWLDA